MLHVKLPPSFSAERHYICGVVLGDFLGLDYRIEVMDRQDVAISRGDGRELRLADVLFQTPGDRWLKPESLPARPLVRWMVPGTVCQPTLPVLYGRQYYEVGPDQIALGLDIFGSIFFLLTRYEEVVGVPVAASLAVQEGFLDRPLADEYVEVLWRALLTLWPGMTRRPRESRVCLSHDVITPSSTLGRNYVQVAGTTAGDLVKRGSPLLAARRLTGSVRTWRGNPDADVCNTFDLIMDIVERHRCLSTFHFITERAPISKDGTYEVTHPWIRKLLRSIHQRGHAIGLHASAKAFKDPDQLGREFERLRQVADQEGIAQTAWGGRQHSLRWEPSSWAVWSAAGLDYDSSLTFPDRPGFRSGTCHEHPVFDLRRRAPLRLRERPLIAMESTVLDRPETDEAVDDIRRLRARCRLVGGDFTLRWQNDRLAGRRERQLFERIMYAL